MVYTRQSVLGRGVRRVPVVDRLRDLYPSLEWHWDKYKQKWIADDGSYVIIKNRAGYLFYSANDQLIEQLFL